MGCKYVKEFEFPGDKKVAVKPYMRGGPVRNTAAKGKETAKEERAEAKQSGDCACRPHAGDARWWCWWECKRVPPSSARSDDSAAGANDEAWRKQEVTSNIAQCNTGCAESAAEP